MDKPLVIIIGAGPAGLTAALELLRDGRMRPLVIEATDAVGGISRTVEYKGNRMDIGGHRFFSKSDWVMDWWREILPVAADSAAVEIAYQGQRNLLAMLKVCKERGGGTLADFDATLEDPVALAKALEDNKEELGKFLKDANDDEDIRKDILSAMASSPHNRNSGEGDKNSLNSDDLYAYELLETMTAPQIVTMIIFEINKISKLPTNVEKALRPLIQRRIGLYDVVKGDAVDRSARNAVVMEIIADLKAEIPALADADFTSFGFSEDMAKMARLRKENCKGANSGAFDEGAQKELQIKLEITAALQA